MYICTYTYIRTCVCVYMYVYMHRHAYQPISPPMDSSTAYVCLEFRVFAYKLGRTIEH